MLCMIFLMGSLNALDWSNGTAACWNFDESSGDLIDQINSHDGTLVNTPVQGATGILGNAYDFEAGDNDIVTVPDHADFDLNANGNTMSFSVWIKPETVNDGIFKKGDNSGVTSYQLGITATDIYWREQSNGLGIAPHGGISVGNWYHLVLTTDGETHRYWVDGVSVLNYSESISYTDNNEVFTIGSYYEANDFDGLIDEFVVFTRKITDQDIQDLYNGGAAVPCGGELDQVTLISPLNNSVLSTLEENFVVNYSAPSGVNLTNATYYIWFENGTIFNNSVVVEISGQSNQTNVSIDSFVFEDYVWNVLLWFDNSSGSFSTWDDQNFTFIVGATIDTESYDTFVYETELINFQINISLLPGSTLFDQDLIYNGTFYTGTQTNLGSDDYTLSLNLDVPLLNSGITSENRSFLWAITFERDDGSFFFQNLSLNQQNISYINLTNCGAPGATDHTLNFTAWEEEDVNTRLSPFDFFGTFEYWLGSGNVKKNISVSQTNVTETNFCLDSNTENLTYHSNANIQYEKDSYVKRSYFLINASLTNTTNNIKLVLLNSSISTSFIIDVIDEDQLPVPNVYLNIQRYYPGLGIYQTVEMGKTDIGGSTVGHFEAETEDYKIIISSNNTVLFQSEAQKIFCRDTPCTLTFQIGSIATTEWIPFGDINGLVWSLNFSNSTQLWTYTFIDTTGAAQSGRLHVYKDNPTSQFTICNSTVSSSAGTITCNVTGQTGTIYAAAYITQSPEILVYLKSAIIGSLKDVFGFEGLFLSSFILLILAMAGLWNPVVGIFLVTIGMIMMSFIGLASFGSVTLWAIIFIGLIIAWGMKT